MARIHTENSVEFSILVWRFLISRSVDLHRSHIFVTASLCRDPTGISLDDSGPCCGPHRSTRLTPWHLLRHLAGGSALRPAGVLF
jgi:hypothetical protein